MQKCALIFLAIQKLDRQIIRDLFAYEALGCHLSLKTDLHLPFFRENPNLLKDATMENTQRQFSLISVA